MKGGLLRFKFGGFESLATQSLSDQRLALVT